MLEEGGGWGCALVLSLLLPLHPVYQKAGCLAPSQPLCRDGPKHLAQEQTGSFSAVVIFSAILWPW